MFKEGSAKKPYGIGEIILKSLIYIFLNASFSNIKILKKGGIHMPVKNVIPFKDQVKLKKRLEILIEKRGTSQRFIANKLDIHEATISRFLTKEDYTLCDDYFRKLEKWLNEQY